MYFLLLWAFGVLWHHAAAKAISCYVQSCEEDQGWLSLLGQDCFLFPRCRPCGGRAGDEMPRRPLLDARPGEGAQA